MHNDQRLDGWKAIANYLGRERTTAIRWGNERGLPVHRVPGGKTGTVYALRAELDTWLASDKVNGKKQSPAEDNEGTVVIRGLDDAERFRLVPAAYAGLFICVLIAAWWIVARPTASAKAPVSIAAVASSTASPETVEFARALTADLARFANASPNLAVYEREPGTVANTQYAVRTEIERAKNKLVAHARLIAVSSGEILWSRRFEQSEPAVSVLRERVAANIVGTLRCSFEGLEDERSKAREVDVAQLMAICWDFEETNLAAAQARARQLTVARPDLATGWALLALIQGNLLEETEDPNLKFQSRANAQRAKELAPDKALTWMALTAVARSSTGDPETLSMTEMALKKHPNHQWLLSQHSIVLFNLGYVQASVAPAISAYRTDPSSLSIRDTAVRRLAAAARNTEGQQLQDENERLWPNHPRVLATRARTITDGAARRKADVETIRNDERVVGADPFVAYKLALIHERTGNRTAARAWLRGAPVRQAHQQWSLLFWPDAAGLRAEPAFFRKMADLGLVRIWVARGEWPDFCADPNLEYDCADEAAKLQRLPSEAPSR